MSKSDDEDRNYFELASNVLNEISPGVTGEVRDECLFFDLTQRKESSFIIVGRNIAQTLPVWDRVIVITWNDMPTAFQFLPSSSLTYFDLRYHLCSRKSDAFSTKLRKHFESHGCSLNELFTPHSRKKLLVAVIANGFRRRVSNLMQRERDIVSTFIAGSLVRRRESNITSTSESFGTIQIRQIVEEDLPLIFELFRKTLLSYPDKNNFKRYFGSFRSTFLVAELDGNVVGYSCCNFAAINYPFEAKLEARLDCIAVLYQHRRSGIGKKLLQITCKKLRAMGIQYLSSVVDGDNIAAIAFFEAIGFKATDKIDDELGFSLNISGLTDS